MTIKLMIAEDELLERKSLKYLVEKNYVSQIEIICETSNGKDAVEKALLLKPDIILMDIRMPGIDGLEASEIIKSRMPNTEIIILTAYGFFEYAQKAIQVGVSDYLLKPYSNEKFCITINKVLEKINQRKKDSSEKERIRKYVHNLDILIEKEIILQMIHSKDLSLRKLIEYKNCLEIDSKAFMCVIFRVDSEMNITEALLQDIKSKLRFVVSDAVGYIFLKDIILLIFDDNLNEKAKDYSFQSAIREVTDHLMNNADTESCYSMSDIYQDLREINFAYNQAKKKIRLKTKDGYPVKSTGLGNLDLKNLYEKELNFCEKVIEEDREGAVTNLKDIIHHLSVYGKDDNIDRIRIYINQLCILLDRSIVQFYGNTFKLINFDSVKKQMDGLSSIKDIQLYMESLINDIILEISQHKKDRNQQRIEAVERYLEEHYCKDISLKDAADYIGLSPAYLSRCFKKTKGINFKDYLTKIRMEKAKYFIREEKKSIAETAFEVGYNDPNYFSKAFKQHVGISPTQYADR